ncbi:MAG: Gfo/Idh/MocA family oxidoreductase, partial [Bifidobacteriaceae bacterium]|nr:Gfo/Idh/MocA family oxidoreductase [Bifidobacteriaceae bacterium]
MGRPATPGFEPDAPRLAVIGAGARGAAYARIARRLGAEVVAVADPDPAARAAAAAEHGAWTCADWRELMAQGRLADAAVIATPDREHVGPAVAAADLGYDILLEKPMAPTEAEALKIVEAAERAGVILAVCHVLRYTAYTQAV